MDIDTRRQHEQFAYRMDGDRIAGTDVGEPDGTTRRVTFAPSGYATREVFRLGRPDEVVVDYERATSSNRTLTVKVTCKRPGGAVSRPVGSRRGRHGRGPGPRAPGRLVSHTGARVARILMPYTRGPEASP